MKDSRWGRLLVGLVFFSVIMAGCGEEKPPRVDVPRSEPGKGALPPEVKSGPPESVTGVQGEKTPFQRDKQ